MFLIEGCLIGFMGGVAGVMLGWLAKFPGNKMGLSEMAKQAEGALPETLFIYPLWLVVIVPVFAMIVTTLAALLPAPSGKDRAGGCLAARIMDSGQWTVVRSSGS